MDDPDGRPRRDAPARDPPRVPRPRRARGSARWPCAVAAPIRRRLLAATTRPLARRRRRRRTSPPKAKRVIYLYMAGGPVAPRDASTTSRSSPSCTASRCPSRSPRASRSPSSRGRSSPASRPQHPFQQLRQVGPGDQSTSSRTSASVADDICIVRSMHDRGDQPRPGPHVHEHRHARSPAGRAWARGSAYGLGSRGRRPARLRRADLARAAAASRSRSPRGSGTAASCPAGSRASSSARKGDAGPLPRATPPGVDAQRSSATSIDAVQRAQPQPARRVVDDPEIATRIAQYEMAFRMQTSVPELMDLSRRAASTSSTCTASKGADGSFASNCLLARRLAERGVRFIQLYHRDWDHHGGIKDDIARARPRRSTRPAAALITDLKQRGMLDDTLVDLGRRVRPHADGPGRRPRPPHQGLLDLAGRRRHQGRASPTARPTSSATTPSRTSSTSTTCTPRCCTCSGIDHTRLTYTLPGPRLPPDRRARRTW